LLSIKEQSHLERSNEKTIQLDKKPKSWPIGKEPDRDHEPTYSTKNDENNWRASRFDEEGDGKRKEGEHANMNGQFGGK